MSLRDEIIKEAESGKNGFVVISGDCAFSEKELDVIINKVLDAVVEAAEKRIEDNPHSDTAFGVNIGIEGVIIQINRLRPKS